MSPTNRAPSLFSTSPAVVLLLIANIAVFFMGYLFRDGSERIADVGALWFPRNGHFGVWQAVSYMFLHGSFTHIFFNMFALVSFGRVIEWEWGTPRFLVFYFVCGVGAGLTQVAIDWQEFNSIHAKLVDAGMTPSAISSLMSAGGGEMPDDPSAKAMLFQLYRIYASPMVGASGAIYGLLVAFGFLHPNARLALMFVPVPIAAKYFIPGIILLDLFSGVTGFSLFGAGIAHYAHVGGAAIGFLLMLLWRKRSRRMLGYAPVGGGQHFE